MLETLSSIISTFFLRVASYLPQFFAGFLILILGLLVAAALKHLVVIFFKVIKIEKWLSETNIINGKEVKVWPEVLAELIRWSIIILFLVPTLEAWGLPRATEVLNQLLLYLPNVLVAVFIGFVGLVVANLIYDIVRHAVRGVGGSQSVALGTLARYSIIFFTVLVGLNQLGGAADLIKILFTGIVTMIAIAGGLAFGLGGKDIAADILKDLRDKLAK